MLHILRKLISSFLFITLPTAPLPIGSTKFPSFKKIVKKTFTILPNLLFPGGFLLEHLVLDRISQAPIPKNLSSLSYDELVDLLKSVESGEFEKHATPAEQKRVIQFFTHLAKKGALPDTQNSFSLERDIYLLSKQSAQISTFICPSKRFAYLLNAQWQGFTEFVKKYKKEIIIGIIIVVVIVVAAVIITNSGGGATPAVIEAGTAVGGGVSVADSYDTSSIQTVIEDDIASFKETIVREGFLEPSGSPNSNNLSIEEKGRCLGSALAHQTGQSIQEQNSSNSQIYQEMHTTQSGYQPISSYEETVGDEYFSTNNTFIYANPNQKHDLSYLTYQLTGESALASHSYQEAVNNFDKAIELEPENPFCYLDRGVAHFNLGDYDKAQEDYETFSKQSSKEPFVVSEFVLGFMKGVPKGSADSLVGLGKTAQDLSTFVGNAVYHPIDSAKQLYHTTQQVTEAFTELYHIGVSQGWSGVAAVTVPEAYELVREWDTLPSNIRGEKAGYIFGKYGTDILVPAAVVKGVKAVKGVQEVASVQRKLQTAKKAFVIESAVASEAVGVKTINSTQKALVLSEELGIAKNAAQLETSLAKGSELLANNSVLQESKNAINLAKNPLVLGGGITATNNVTQLEAKIAKGSEFFANNPPMQASYELYTRAEDFLTPYNDYMPEAHCKALIEHTGIETFPRPEGIPENFRVKISNTGAGMEYVHPTNNHIRVRVMPGEPHSPFPCQQKPYVVYMKHGQFLDKLGNTVDQFGNPLSKQSPEVHIPIDEFIYRSN